MIILDTNILSELMRPLPAAEVTQWLDGLDETRLVSTAITAWELLYGESLLPHGRQRLARDIQALLTEFAGRWMPFDVDAAREAADIQASCRRTGRPIDGRGPLPGYAVPALEGLWSAGLGPASPSRREPRGAAPLRLPVAGRPPDFRSFSRRLCPPCKRRDSRQWNRGI